jgi:hypothetical protein
VRKLDLALRKVVQLLALGGGASLFLLVGDTTTTTTTTTTTLATRRKQGKRRLHALPVAASGDVVIYTVLAYSDSDSNSDSARRVGVVAEDNKVYRLGHRGAASELVSEDAVELYYYGGGGAHYDAADPLELADIEVVKKIDGEMVSVSQRICSDRVENPHGEHAEDVFIVDARELTID